MHKQQSLQEGLSEIVNLGIKMGAKKDILWVVRGGDLALSCSSLKSRNAKFGYNLAKDKISIKEFFT